MFARFHLPVIKKTAGEFFDLKRYGQMTVRKELQQLPACAAGKAADFKDSPGRLLALLRRLPGKARIHLPPQSVDGSYECSIHCAPFFGVCVLVDRQCNLIQGCFADRCAARGIENFSCQTVGVYCYTEHAPSSKAVFFTYTVSNARTVIKKFSVFIGCYR
jgi:hypothetical protein